MYWGLRSCLLPNGHVDMRGVVDIDGDAGNTVADMATTDDGSVALGTLYNYMVGMSDRLVKISNRLVTIETMLGSVLDRLDEHEERFDGID